MNKTEQSPSGKFTLLSNDKGVYQIKLEGEGSMWLDLEELRELIQFVNTLQLPTE